MSQTTSLILVGSRAANISGHLPSWRNGEMDDYDFYGSSEDMQNMKDWMISTFENPEWLVDKRGCMHYVDRRELCICIMKDDGLPALLTSAPDTFTGSILSRDCLVIGPYSQMAIKLGYFSRCGFHFEKNKKDLSFWLETLDPQGWYDNHMEVLLKMRENSFALFEREFEPFGGSEEEFLLAEFINK